MKNILRVNRKNRDSAAEQHGEQIERDDAKNDFVFVFAGGDPPYPLLQSMGIKFGGDSSQKKELVDKTVKNAA